MKQHGYYNVDFTGFMIFIGVIAASIGAMLMLAIPIIWAWIKPIIHEATK